MIAPAAGACHVRWYCNSARRRCGGCVKQEASGTQSNNWSSWQTVAASARLLDCQAEICPQILQKCLTFHLELYLKCITDFCMHMF